MADAPRPAAPSGLDDLAVRERWLRRQRARDFAARRSGLIALWVAVVAVVAWLFVAGFTGLGH
jgi:cell division septal protein FtsQ